MLLSLEVRSQLRDILSKELENKVKLKLFSQAIGCETCQVAEELLKEVSQIEPEKIELEVYSPLIERDVAQAYAIERVPTIVIEGEKDYGIRYIGLPAGLEFSTLVQGIVQVSKRAPRLSEKTVEMLKSIDKPLEIMVFVTTSCGYCPSAAITAMNFAIASDYIKALVVDASENPDLAERFQVVGVPKIVINRGLVEFVGAQPENAFLGYIISAYEKLRREENNGQA
ncbi:glutaredoxin-like domain protein [Hydrogenobacter thermophilus TK-6]|uniref:Glutaredoxin-like protein n=1 Tax=Hydrogenobacter thermophilus (strain DSM 6534 / IAM 12695 / TK-6) TaxID=608538 RepID=D3DIZ3_HYDTT|nr:thioredoxin family protein [Hydrogenobacter thermophilus]ADO45720.1 glutaredoxin-like domain protein [Hydrogenobacter thermophilus TK-6]BAI69795.1 glutaredoxin-like protein [Hydrogenobacter thermophilus TK-6]